MGSRNSSTSPLNKLPPSKAFQPPPLKVSLRKDQQEDEIKKYAETAMNELLGWYGYEKIDSADTQGLQLRHFDVHPSATLMASSHKRASMQLEESQQRRFTLSRRRQKAPPARSESTDSEEEINSSSQLDAQLLSSPKDRSHSDIAVCSWCQQVGARTFDPMTSSDEFKDQQKTFCSEQCFAQCRRATFKRNRVCDWCKHARHTMNYVDYQDSETQLQFCSEKCLNQCKMSIFCKEAQAHLQLQTQLVNNSNSHQSSSGTSAAAAGNNILITPELWLKDCKNSDDDCSGLAGAGSISPKSTFSSGSNQSVSPVPKTEATPPLPKPHTPNKQKVRERNCKDGEQMRHPEASALPGMPPDQPLFHLPPNFLPEHFRMPQFRPFFAHPLRPPPLGLMPPNFSGRPLLPPVTIMVPFPVPLPIPIPIPIVLPLFGPPAKVEEPVAGPSTTEPPAKDEQQKDEPAQRETRMPRKKRKIA